MFKRIVVPVDGSKYAIDALEKAIELQALTGAELHILTVYRHHSLLEASFSMVRSDEPETPLDKVMREHAREVAEQAKTFAAGKGVTTPRAFVRKGPVARSIVAFAQEHDCDLIVLGSRGMGSVEAYLLGSVSHKVTGLAEMPVLVV